MSKRTEKDEAESSKETKIWTDVGTDEDKGEVWMRGLEQGMGRKEKPEGGDWEGGSVVKALSLQT